MNAHEPHTVDPLSFLLGMYATFWDIDDFRREVSIDVTAATKQWLKHYATLGKSLSTFGGDMGHYLSVLGFIPEEALTDIMKTEFLIMEELSKDKPNVTTLEKSLEKKVNNASRAIDNILSTKEDVVTNTYVLGKYDPKKAEGSVVVVSAIETATQESDPVKEEPSGPKKDEPWRNIDPLTIRWLIGYF